MKTSLPPFPDIPVSFRATTVSARFVELVWSPAPGAMSTSAMSAFRDRSMSISNGSNSDMNSVSRTVHYQISKAVEDENVFEPIYEGPLRACTINSLAPLTAYTFKLKTRWSDHPAGEWSVKFAVLDVVMTDESAINKATQNLIRGIKSNDEGEVMHILDEIGREINVETTDKEGRTLLMLAAQHSKEGIVISLLKAGADPNQMTNAGKSPLSMAVTSGNLEAVKVLLENGAYPDLVDSGGSTPLMWALQNAHNKTSKEVIKVLLKQNLDLKKTDSQGLTAFDRLCCSNGDVDIGIMLMDSGAEIINEVDKTKPRTSLMMCALNGHAALCEELIKRGADVNVKNEFGNTAGDMALHAGRKELGDRLKSLEHSL